MNIRTLKNNYSNDYLVFFVGTSEEWRLAINKMQKQLEEKGVLPRKDEEGYE
jgi:hypothetical protein